jgi:hypothetical protein
VAQEGLCSMKLVSSLIVFVCVCLDVCGLVGGPVEILFFPVTKHNLLAIQKLTF